jgi:hypothetical protein
VSKDSISPKRQYQEAKSGQVKSGQVKSGQVKSGQVKSGQVKSSQVKSSQVKSSAAVCLLGSTSPRGRRGAQGRPTLSRMAPYFGKRESQFVAMAPSHAGVRDPLPFRYVQVNLTRNGNAVSDDDPRALVGNIPNDARQRFATVAEVNPATQLNVT